MLAKQKSKSKTHIKIILIEYIWEFAANFHIPVLLESC